MSRPQGAPVLIVGLTCYSGWHLSVYNTQFVIYLHPVSNCTGLFFVALKVARYSAFKECFFLNIETYSEIVADDRYESGGTVTNE